MATSHRTRALLTAGIVAGLLVAVLSFTLALITAGFDLTRHANSLLVLGEWGWLQTINFLVFGILVTLAAAGARQALRGKPGGTWAPLLLAIYGIGCFVVGLAPADPAFGFPPGTETVFTGYGSVSRSAQIHGVAGGIAFTAMAFACFAFARYFASVKQYGWLGLSLVTGASVFVVTGYLASYADEQVTSFDYTPTWVVGTLLWLYVSLVSWKLRKDFT